MLVVDTSVWVDYFNGVENPQTNFLHNVLDATPILIGDLILTEILQGFRHDPDFETVRRTLGRFTQANMVDTALAVQSARNYRFLRQKGITVRKTIDSLIATFCIENEYELLHNDNDFDGYEKHLGLRVIHP
ncbi:MAG: PIN domain nuclease [Anaerolineales bacterium]|uniref:type II toxin-antitoxin system VapC family toxin n=1 Tax=Candidatus Villigracilis vicinus TaxID=3140679 RepID=UPI003135C759|nr:PIN domain nuclease [Anaerolineales bacterium]